MRPLSVFAAALSSVLVSAQQPLPVNRTMVNPDHSVTFRYTDTAARTVLVQTDAVPAPIPMQRDAAGVWSATTPPLPPERYSYSFRVDGLDLLDPLNHTVLPNLLGGSNGLLVPAEPPAPWELTAVPHGTLARHLYTTHIGLNLPENQETYLVYTPPGYDRAHKGGYPVLYLLHGWSDGADGWTAVGYAHYILDALLAERKIVPMIVVMPEGYGDYSFVTSGHEVWNDPARVADNVDLFTTMLTEEIMPAVQRDYAVSNRREQRAIAGLSMGGLEALRIGLIHHELFSYVGSMSAALHQEHFDQQFPAFAAADGAKLADLRLLWVACGRDDRLVTPNRDFVTWARARGLPVKPVETPGQHTWLVWRQNLLTLAPLLFR